MGTTVGLFEAVLVVDALIDVTVVTTMEVEVEVDMGVAGILVEKPPEQWTSHSVPTPFTSLEGSIQTAVQPLLVTVTVACRLARTGLPMALVAFTVDTRLTSPKTTDLLTRILSTFMRLMDAMKYVQVVYWSVSNDMG